MVVDGRSSWIGTSNWDRDYFYASRNLGLLIGSVEIGDRLDRYFLKGWNSVYATPVDPGCKYNRTRIGE